MYFKRRSTVISGGRRDGSGVTGKKAVKPVTAVQDCVSLTIMDIFDEKLGISPAVFVVKENM